MKRFLAWLSTPSHLPSAAWCIIARWGVRRIPVNLLVAVYGIVCLLIFFFAIATSGRLEPGEDALEPLALIAAPLVFNVMYTLGWLMEVPVRLLVPNVSSRFGPALLKGGLGLVIVLISLPPVIWTAYRLGQLVGLVP